MRSSALTRVGGRDAGAGRLTRTEPRRAPGRMQCAEAARGREASPPVSLRRSGRYAARVAGLLVVAAATGSSGCANDHKDLVVFLRSHEHLVSSGRYRLAPPDVILLSAPIAPEIDNQSQRIRADGKISLRLLGEVKVVGLTPQELAGKLETLLSRYYNDPKVSVQVTEYASQKYYVFGEVGRQGVYPYTGRDTVLDALALSQPTFLAWRSKIKIIRPSADAENMHEIIVDLDRIGQRGDLRLNVMLQDGDVVWVPPTPLGWVGLRIRELVFPFSEASAAVSTFVGTAVLVDQNRNNNNNNNNDNRFRIFSR